MIRQIPNPSTRRWTGPYPGNYLGDLWKTFNIDLDRSEGKIKLSPQMIARSAPLDTGSVVNAFLRTDADCEDRYWALNDKKELLKTDSSSTVTPLNDWDTDPLDSTPTQPLDFTVHGNDSRFDSGRNKLFVTTDTGDIAVLNDTGDNKWTGSWWVTKQGQPRMDTSTRYNPIEFFPFRKITLVGDRNRIHTISRPSDTQNDTVTYSRLVIPRDYIIDHIFTTRDRAWICCHNAYSGNGCIVEWDGFSQSYNNLHNAHAIGALSGLNYNEIPIVINSKGAVLEFNGNAFVPMIRNEQRVGFPSIENFGAAASINEGVGFQPFISPRGMTLAEDNLIYVNHAGDDVSFTTHKEYSEGGIWCLNPLSGRLYKKFSFTYDSTTYGYQKMSGSGAIISVPPLISNEVSLMASALISDTSLGNVNDIWTLDKFSTLTKISRGYFVTQFIPADEIKEFWAALWLRFNRFQTTGSTFGSANNAIVIKAKGVRSLVNENGLPIGYGITITWTSATTFTINLGTTSADQLAVGDEVEVLSGANAGTLSHITQISGAHGGAQTITVDETMGKIAGLSEVLIDRWKKIGTITDPNIYKKMLNIGIDSTFIQFKVELRGNAHDLEINDLTIVSKPSINLE